MQNHEIAKIFSRISLYLQIEDVPFKPQAYERAAMSLQALSEDVAKIYAAHGLQGLQEIPGVGKSIAEKIAEYLVTGKVQEYEDYKKKMPIDIEELASLEGVGPKMIRELWRHLKITNIKELEDAARAGKIRALPHCKEKTEQNILQGIAFFKRAKGRWLLGNIAPYVEDIVSVIQESGLAKNVVPAGSWRRMKETVGDIDILVSAQNAKKTIAYVLSHVPYSKVWGKGATKVSLRTTYGFDVDIRVLPEDVFGAGLQYFTGSKEHNTRLRTYAISKGYKLSEYGVFKGKKRIACKTEQEVYATLGLPYIEPELREDQGEIQAALAGTLPQVIPYESLKGDLQVQTNWTDGENSIEDMAKEAKKREFKYIAITDHTRDLAMTGGMDEKKLVRQMAEIDRVNARISGITVLKGAEVNIRQDGTLDITDEALSKLDVVGISVHSHFAMTREDMTKRIVRAMSNPNADILFHPTGRLIHKREGYDVDMTIVIQQAVATGTVLEINAHPERLDLRDTHIRQAKAAGARFAIDSDAHRAEHFKFLPYGIAQARRGWVERSEVINTYSLDKLRKSLKDKKHA